MIVILVVTGRKSTNRHGCRLQKVLPVFLFIVSCYCRVYTWDIATMMARWCRSRSVVTVHGPGFRYSNICALQGTVPYIVQRESVPYGFLSFGQFWSEFYKARVDDPPSLATHLCRLPLLFTTVAGSARCSPYGVRYGYGRPDGHTDGRTDSLGLIYGRIFRVRVQYGWSTGGVM